MDLSTNKTLTVIAKDNTTSIWTLITSIATDSVAPVVPDESLSLGLRLRRVHP
jgi:hypothetical protein